MDSNSDLFSIKQRQVGSGIISGDVNAYNHLKLHKQSSRFPNEIPIIQEFEPFQGRRRMGVMKQFQVFEQSIKSRELQ